MDWLPTLLAAAGSQPDPAYPAGRREPGADPDRRARHRIRASCSGATRRARSAPCATATGNICGSPATNSCSMWSGIRASGPISRIVTRTCSIGLKSDWEAWNNTMLPERARPALYGNPGVFLPDHYGVVNPPPPDGTRARRATLSTLMRY